MITGKVLGEVYIKNGDAYETRDFIPDMSGEIYYEVVRILGSRFLFLEDHLDRLEHSLSGSGILLPARSFIKESLRLLLKYNPLTNGNIRICIQKEAGNKFSLLCYFIPFLYPEECFYKSGVQIVTYPYVRPNPGIKKWDDAFRVAVSRYIRDHGVYEVILMNHKKQITEGSRSNVFFLDQKNTLVSPPEEDILQGITRKYVLEICRKGDIPVIERPVYLEDVHQMAACFISGTSPKILPVWQLDGFQFNAGHPILRKLMDRFGELMEEHLTTLN